MTAKRFTDELFRKMYDLGYRKALIGKGYVFFFALVKIRFMD